MGETDAALLSTGRAVTSLRNGTGRAVVWISGEHDVSTIAELSAALARAIAADDTDLVVDLSQVRFMGASTVGVILRARGFLRERSRSMVLRSPSPCARRVLEVCDLLDIVQDPVDRSPGPVAKALASWIAVPVAHRIDDRAPDPKATVPIEVGVVASAATS